MIPLEKSTGSFLENRILSALSEAHARMEVIKPVSLYSYQTASEAYADGKRNALPMYGSSLKAYKKEAPALAYNYRLNRIVSIESQWKNTSQLCVAGGAAHELAHAKSFIPLAEDESVALALKVERELNLDNSFDGCDVFMFLQRVPSECTAIGITLAYGYVAETLAVYKADAKKSPWIAPRELIDNLPYVALAVIKEAFVQNCNDGAACREIEKTAIALLRWNKHKKRICDLARAYVDSDYDAETFLKQLNKYL